MTSADATRLLDLPPGAAPEQIEARFLELRTKLEDKIAKAPTPGLKAKYRESLAEITTAFETLTFAADSSALPVLKKESGHGSQGSAAQPAAAASPPRGPETGDHKSKSRNRKSGKEFLVVTLLAVAVLGAGGWWLIKTKRENQQQASLSAAQKAEADRRAQLAREQAEQERLARTAAEKEAKEAAERTLTRLRARQAELNVAFDALVRTEQVAERELAELRSQQRDAARGAAPGSQSQLRFGAELRLLEAHVAWLRDLLPAHPARIAKAQAEEMLSARAADEATAKVEAYAAAVDRLREELQAARQQVTENRSQAVRAIREAHARAVLGYWRNAAATAASDLTLFVLRRVQSLAESREFPSGTTDLPATPEEAVAWLAEAGAGGDLAALHHLGLAHETGWGTPKDETRAVALWNQTAQAGHGDSMHKLGWAHIGGNGGLPRNNTVGFDWLRKAAEAGHLKALQDYAICHYQGLGLPANPAEAVRWWRRGAERGDGQSMSWLATAHEEGKGAPRDPELAMQWLRKSVAARNSRGIANLAYKHWTGEHGVPRDDAKAVELWRQSADLGSVGAMNNLAYAYEVGRGVPKDDALSLDWRRRAARNGYEAAQKHLRDRGLGW